MYVSSGGIPYSIYYIYIYILYLLISSEISYIAWWNPMPPPCRLPAIFFRIPGISRIDLDERENPILCHDFLVGILMYNGGINIQLAIYNWYWYINYIYIYTSKSQCIQILVYINYWCIFMYIGYPSLNGSWMMAATAVATGAFWGPNKMPCALLARPTWDALVQGRQVSPSQKKWVRHRCSALRWCF